jgi:hypothetical protein
MKILVDLDDSDIEVLAYLKNNLQYQKINIDRIIKHCITCRYAQIIQEEKPQSSDT